MVSEGNGRRTFALVLLCCASFIAVLDLTIVAIALPSVRRELGFSGGDAQWILTGFALSFGGLSCCSWAAPATFTVGGAYSYPG
jgi:MFS family permease